MAVRRTSKVALQRRVADLEGRVRRLEGRGPAPRPRPAGQGRPPPARGPTCPGCSLRLPSARGATRCVWCGFRLDAVAPVRARPIKRRR